MIAFHRRNLLAFLLLGSVGANAQTIDFQRDVQPVLADNCYLCHGPDGGRRKADLRLDMLDPKLGPFAPRDGYSIIAPGDLENSVLVMRITSDDPDVHMPPPDSKRHLTAAQIELIKKWIAQGAKWGKHWSLVPPRRPALPEIKGGGWVRNPIDRFIFARLEREGITPSPEASKETLIRRVTLELTGLPPTPAEVDSFLADSSTDAYEKVVDRLLASPRYGERMVWEWLDLARYADTNGYQGDATRTMWPWRDWVVKALNANMPFDQFAIRQLAGDLIPQWRGIEEPAPNDRPTARDEDRLATAFLRNHMINGEGGRIPAENRVEYVMDQSETVSTAFLGLTVGCARCHDHKFDPITQKDYYALFAFFNNMPVDGADGSGQAKPILDMATAEQRKQADQLTAAAKKRSRAVAELEKLIFPRTSTQPTAADSAKAAGLSGNIITALKQAPENRGLPFLGEMVNYFKDSQPKYSQALDDLRSAIDNRDHANVQMPKVMVAEELPAPRDAFILVKGSYDKPGEKVTADTPACLPPLSGNARKDRLALARWLFSPEHPLTARVAVNRWWQQFFGTGIVKTVEDFGVQGERPSYPELLDWLAVEFRESGWNVKAMHRLMVTSAAYRQSSKVTAEMGERDPENRLLARGPRFRLPAFVIRDQALAAGGLLVEKVGGPPVRPYQPAGVWEEATFGLIKYSPDHGEALYRRSLYTFWRRIVGPPEFFDSASRQTCIVRQPRTNTPLHALTTLNDPTFVEAARALAERVMLGANEPSQRLAMAFRLVTARRPTEAETAILLGALERLKGEYAADTMAATKLLSVGESKRNEKLDPAEHAAYTGVCQEILNLDETLTKQ
jgi:hypothetical protein